MFFLVDVFSVGITGKQAEAALENAGITVNKNAIPFDAHPPLVTSGVRIGTPAITTRGMKEEQMEQIGELIGRVLKSVDSEQIQRDVREEVKVLTDGFQIYSQPLTEPEFSVE